MPVPENYHIDAALTTFAVEIGAGGPFVADKIFPIVEVKKESDKYKIYPKPEIRDDVETIRSASGLAPEIDWKPSEDTYSCKEHALRRFIPDRTRNNADNPIKLEQNTIRKLLHKIRLGIEKRVKSIGMSPSYITNNATPSVKWDSTTSTPEIEKNIDTAKEAVVKQCGFEPNIIVIPPAVAKVIKRDPSIRELIKYTNSDLLVNGDLPPTIFNLKVIIPGAIEDISNPAQAQDLARIWSEDNVLIAYVDPEADDTDTITLGKQFRCKMTAHQVDELIAVWRYREEARHGEWFEVGLLNDEKLISAACGFLLTDVLA